MFGPSPDQGEEEMCERIHHSFEEKVAAVLDPHVEQPRARGISASLRVRRGRKGADLRFRRGRLSAGISGRGFGRAGSQEALNKRRNVHERPNGRFS